MNGKPEEVEGTRNSTYFAFIRVCSSSFLEVSAALAVVKFLIFSSWRFFARVNSSVCACRVLTAAEREFRM